MPGFYRGYDDNSSDPAAILGAALEKVGLNELIGARPNELLSIASKLAVDVNRLAELRTSMRSRLAASALMDAPRFTRNIESAFRQAWTWRLSNCW